MSFIKYQIKCRKSLAVSVSGLCEIAFGPGSAGYSPVAKSNKPCGVFCCVQNLQKLDLTANNFNLVSISVRYRVNYC